MCSTLLILYMLTLFSVTFLFMKNIQKNSTDQISFFYFQINKFQNIFTSKRSKCNSSRSQLISFETWKWFILQLSKFRKCERHWRKCICKLHQTIEYYDSSFSSIHWKWFILQLSKFRKCERHWRKCICYMHQSAVHLLLRYKWTKFWRKCFPKCFCVFSYDTEHICSKIIWSAKR